MHAKELAIGATQNTAQKISGKLPDFRYCLE